MVAASLLEETQCLPAICQCVQPVVNSSRAYYTSHSGSVGAGEFEVHVSSGSSSGFNIFPSGLVALGFLVAH